MWDATHDARPVKAVHVLKSFSSMEPRIFKCGELRLELCDKEGIIRQ